MGYNKYRWWMKGVKKHRPLSKYAGLLEKVQHGDYDYPQYIQDRIDELYQEIQDITHHILSGIPKKEHVHYYTDVRDATKMKNVRIRKLKQELFEKEYKQLRALREDFRSYFKFDLWDEFDSFDGSVYDLYFHYVRQCKTRNPVLYLHLQEIHKDQL